MARRSHIKSSSHYKRQSPPKPTQTTSRSPSHSPPPRLEVALPSHKYHNPIRRTSSEPSVNTPLPTQPVQSTEIQTIIYKLEEFLVFKE